MPTPGSPYPTPTPGPQPGAELPGTLALGVGQPTLDDPASALPTRGPTGGLADTGAQLGTWLALGALLLALGGLLATRRRPRNAALNR